MLGFDEIMLNLISAVVLIMGHEKNRREKKQNKTPRPAGFHKQTLPMTFVNTQRLSEAENKLHNFLSTCQKQAWLRADEQDGADGLTRLRSGLQTLYIKRKDAP